MTQSQVRRPFSRTLRFVAPNAVTALSILCAVMAVQAALRGEIVTACWWVTYSTLTDKLDGLVARAVKGSSPLGVQMDSLADLLNYGFVPSAITYAFFLKHPEIGGWGQGTMHYALMLICFAYALCAALRLARFNVSAGNPNFFFGVPSTFSGAIVVAMLIVLCRYGDPSWAGSYQFRGPRLFGDVDLRSWMQYFPLVLPFFAWAMVSGWRVPKLGKVRNRFVNAFVVVNLIAGYTACMLQLIPEYLVVGAWFYLGFSAWAHYFDTPKERPEPYFPV